MSHVATEPLATMGYKRVEASCLAGGFITVAVIIIVDLVARALFPSYRSWWEFYVVWEAASIVFTLVLTIVHWIRYFHKGDDAYGDVLRTLNELILLAVLILTSALGLLFAAICALFIKEWLLPQMASLTVGTALIVVAELKIRTAVPNAIEEVVDKEIARLENTIKALGDQSVKQENERELAKQRKRRAAFNDIAEDVGKYLAFSDAPICMAFVCLLVFVFVHWTGVTGLKDDVLVPPFIAGAVAVQLLYSNAVFFIEANGGFPKWAQKLLPGLKLLSPMIQGLPGRAEVSVGSLSSTVTVEAKPMIVEKPTPVHKLPTEF